MSCMGDCIRLGPDKVPDTVFIQMSPRLGNPFSSLAGVVNGNYGNIDPPTSIATKIETILDFRSSARFISSFAM